MKYLMLKFSGLTFICLLLLTNSLVAQTKYQQSIDSAMHFYDSKEYAKAGAYFAKAAKINNNRDTQTNRYNAACSWSLANQPDLAFKELDHILLGKGMIRGWDDPTEFHNMLLKDADFANLKKDKRWEKVIAASAKRKTLFETNVDQKLVAELATVRKEDQGLRLKLDTIRKDKGPNSVEEKDLWKKINHSDSINLAKIETLLDQKGWLAPEQVGYVGSQTIFLVIQHANLAVQQKYLPMMRAAVKKGSAMPNDLALLEDRVAMREGKSQIYGSQITIDKETKKYYLYPVIDPDHLDDRRATVGLEPIANYLKSFSLNWDLETYKKELPALEAKVKKK
ncbi:DUF6624 domain-containing protein [Pedobacter sp. Hv1]|uniref:DUF6624 domain-containing protein n=1 Tax=Pedobacter sp. Hv1 TaxID=1740090 RepID=UPI0006D8AB58|nr:DUF6624 domain-containing protein [Pedobacter sp. Hv1]KQC01041.1 hypothetical protein AQF98_10255 [Pedobacter sp. Hv1]